MGERDGGEAGGGAGGAREAARGAVWDGPGRGRSSATGFELVL